MAAHLPLELQQQIFDFLDPRSFHAARNVCRWWRASSRGATTLTKQLRKLPIEPQSSAARDNPERLHSLYNESAHKLMLGIRVDDYEHDEPSLARAINQAKIAMSPDGRCAVSLDARKLTVYDLASRGYPITQERPLNDLRAAIGGGPWFKCAPSCVYELALSSNGHLLAIALDRTIQIYDLAAGSDSWPIASFISSASGHYIASLEFEHNDSLLRVQMSNKGTVVYLGSPKASQADIGHWRERGGLRNAYLDTSKIAVKASPGPGTERLAGLQLLRPLRSGWLFAAQKHGANSASTYCIGHLASHDGKATNDDDAFLIAAPATEATVLASLPSTYSAYLSSVPSAFFWGRLPSAREQQPPHFSLSPDGRFLALAEASSKGSAADLHSRVFVYRMPGTKELARRVEKSAQEPPQTELELEQEQELKPEAAEEVQMAHSSDERKARDFVVHHVPLGLGTARGRLLGFGFVGGADGEAVGHGDGHGHGLLASTRSGEHGLSLTTEVGTQTWLLRGD